MRSWINRNMLNDRLNLSGQRRDLTDTVDFIPKKLNTDCRIPGIGGKNLNNITMYAELVPNKVNVVAVILDVDEAVQKFIAFHLHSGTQRDHHAAVVNWAS